MDRQFYLDLAKSGLRMPIGADLTLHEKPNPAEIVTDGKALGRWWRKRRGATARRSRSPHGSAARENGDPGDSRRPSCRDPVVPLQHRSRSRGGAPPAGRTAAAAESCPPGPYRVGGLHRRTDGLVPIGMTIGPFSLMTKLLKDPITPIYLAGSGMTAADDPDVALVDRALELSLTIILSSVEAQIRAGAKAIFMAEPAANIVYVSPSRSKAVPTSSSATDCADRRVKALLDRHGVDLIFHCCGELNEYMVRQFTTLHPVIISLGVRGRSGKMPGSCRRTS